MKNAVTSSDHPGEARPRPIRVLWLIKGLGPGGAERLLVESARVRDRENFSYEVAYLLPRKHMLVPDLDALGVAVECFDVSNERDLRWLGLLRRRLIERPVDIVHVHSPYVAAMARLAISSLRTSRRPRIVSTEHNAWSGFKPATRYANAWTSRLDAARLAVSDETRQSMSRAARERTETLVHGIDVLGVGRQRDQRDGVRAEFGLDDDTIVVGTVANYHPKKDWPNLLGAARLVADTGANVKFLAAGQGPLQAQIELLHRQLGLQDVVHLTGYRSDAIRLMAGCDIFALASLWEGMPVAAMEALALGLPIISTAVGGIVEAFGSTTDAVLVPPSDSSALAHAILALAQDDDARAELRVSSLRRSLDFDATRAQRRIEQIYREVASDQ